MADAPAPEPTLLERHRSAAAAHLPPVRLIIGAEERATGSGGVHRHVNPATGQVQAELPLAGPAEVDDAVRAARAGAAAWQALAPARRREVLTRLADLLGQIDWAVLQVLENGQPLSHATTLERFAVEWTGHLAGWADRLHGEVVAAHPDDGLIYTVREPVGVVAVVITWNAPVLSLGMKVVAALAAGNAVVLKPSELTPFTSMVFTHLAREAGVPEGVINVVPGGVDAGAALVGHPGVDLVTFTGGPDTARAIMRIASERLTPVLFELGGKGANLLFADADLDEAVPYSCWFAMSNSGQGCALPTRLLVERSVYADVVDRIEATFRRIRVGDPLHPKTFVGPVIDARAADRITGLVERAVASGSGRLLVGGGRAGGELAAGSFVEPTVLVDVDPESELGQREVFGPVLSVIPFDDEDDAVRIADGTEYGLSNYVQSRDQRRVQRVVGRLRSGTVGVNGGSCLFPGAPFGGVGLSGMGREGGRAGVEELTRLKAVLHQ